MNRLLSGAVALAIVGAIFQALRSDRLAESGADEAFAYALANSFWFLVGLVTAGAILTWAFVRDAEPRDVPPHAHHRRFHL